MATFFSQEDFVRFTRILLLCLLIPGTMVYGAVAEPDRQDYLKNGNAWFKRGNYDYAVKSYLLALKNGRTAPVLYHNLGVALYKSGRFTESKAAFRKSARYRQYQAQAFLNLALAEIKTGDIDTAKQWLLKLKTAPATKPIRIAGLKLLGRVDRELRERAADQWQMFWFVNSGFEDAGVPIREELLGTRVQGNNTYLDTTYYISKKLAGTWYNQISVNSTGYMLSNSNDENPGLWLLSVGLESGKEFSGGANRNIGLDLSYINLDNSDYLSSVDAYLKTRWRLYGGSLQLRLHWMVERELANEFEAAAGIRHKMRWSWYKRWRTWRGKSLFEAENNRRSESVTLVNTPNFSPVRIRLRQVFSRYIGGWQTRWLLEHRISRDRLGRNLPGPDIREENRSIFRSYWGRSFNQNWDWGLEYEYYYQDSTINTFTFDRQRISLQLSWQKSHQ